MFDFDASWLGVLAIAGLAFILARATWFKDGKSEGSRKGYGVGRNRGRKEGYTYGKHVGSRRGFAAAKRKYKGNKR